MKVKVYKVRASYSATSADSDYATYEVGKNRELVTVRKLRDGWFEAKLDQIEGGDHLTIWDCRVSAVAESPEKLVERLLRAIFFATQQGEDLEFEFQETA